MSVDLSSEALAGQREKAVGAAEASQARGRCAMCFLRALAWGPARGPFDLIAVPLRSLAGWPGPRASPPPMFSLFCLSRLWTWWLACTLTAHSAQRSVRWRVGGDLPGVCAAGHGRQGEGQPAQRELRAEAVTGTHRRSCPVMVRHGGGLTVRPQCAAWTARMCHCPVSWMGLKDPRGPAHGCLAKGMCDGRAGAGLQLESQTLFQLQGASLTLT